MGEFGTEEPKYSIWHAGIGLLGILGYYIWSVAAQKERWIFASNTKKYLQTLISFNPTCELRGLYCLVESGSNE